MKRLKSVTNEFDKKLDEIIKPDEDTLFNSVEDAHEWLRKVIELEDANDNSI